MQERTGLVTMKGNPVTLIGPELKVGDRAPDFTVVGNDLSQVSLESFRGKVSRKQTLPLIILTGD